MSGDARQLVSGPSKALKVAAFANGLFCALAMFRGVLRIGEAFPVYGEAGVAAGGLGMAFYLPWVGVAVFTYIAGAKMSQLEGRGFCTAAAVLCHCVYTSSLGSSPLPSGFGC
jgi:hypothetical protein